MEDKKTFDRIAALAWVASNHDVNEFCRTIKNVSLYEGIPDEVYEKLRSKATEACGGDPFGRYTFYSAFSDTALIRGVRFRGELGDSGFYREVAIPRTAGCAAVLNQVIRVARDDFIHLALSSPPPRALIVLAQVPKPMAIEPMKNICVFSFRVTDDVCPNSIVGRFVELWLTIGEKQTRVLRSSAEEVVSLACCLADVLYVPGDAVIDTTDPKAIFSAKMINAFVLSQDPSRNRVRRRIWTLKKEGESRSGFYDAIRVANPWLTNFASSFNDIFSDVVRAANEWWHSPKPIAPEPDDPAREAWRERASSIKLMTDEKLAKCAASSEPVVVGHGE